MSFFRFCAKVPPVAKFSKFLNLLLTAFLTINLLKVLAILL